VPGHGPGACPLVVPFLFSSELFEGTCLIRLRGTDGDNPEGDAAYLASRKCTFQSVVHGRFKEEVPVSNVMSGHEFVQPLRNLPHPFALQAATNFIKKISPGADVVVYGDQPYMHPRRSGGTRRGTSRTSRRATSSRTASCWWDHSKQQSTGTEDKTR